MPHHEETPADQVVNLALVRGKVGLLRRNRCGDDGVVVAYLAVVHIPLAQGPLSRSGSQLLLIACRNRRDNPWSCSGNIGRKMTAVGPADS